MKSKIKSALGEKRWRILAYRYQQFKSVQRYLSIYLSRPFMLSRRLSAILYVFSGSFDRESFASLKGRFRYMALAQKNYSLYRRNVHRLEKALIMRPRRAKFAEDYIAELVSSHNALSPQLEDIHLEWGQHVLEEYFLAIEEGSSLIIDSARQEFTADKNRNSQDRCKVPHTYADKIMSDVSYEQMLNLAKARKSVRWFIDKPVELSLIEKAVEVATQAPSACNRQPFTFHFTNIPEKAQKIASYAMGSAGFISNIQSIVCIVGDLSYYDSTHDRHVIYVDSSLANMQMLLALETLGLGACVLNWPDIADRDKKISTYLQLPDYQRVINLVVVGYPDPEGLIPYSDKKTSGQLIKEI